MFLAIASYIQGEDDPPESPAKPMKIAKGQCRHCGKQIGRGLWRHEQKCKEAK